MSVRDYVSRGEVMNDPEGKLAKVKWERINKEAKDKPDVRCRLVAHELGYGEKLGVQICRDFRIYGG